MSAPLTSTQLAFALGLWGTGVYCSLQLQYLPWPVDHGVCGPWGCGPPTEALLACHIGWLAMLAGPTWLMTRLTPVRVQRFIGIMAATVALGGLVGVALHEAFIWWPQAGEWSRPYWFHRFLFCVVTWVDAPLLPTLLCGSWLIRSSREDQIATVVAAGTH